MKKLRERIISFIAILALLAFSACGNAQTAPAAVTTSAESTSVSVSVAAAISDTVVTEAETTTNAESSEETVISDITESAEETRTSAGTEASASQETSESKETSAAPESSENAETTVLPETSESAETTAPPETSGSAETSAPIQTEEETTSESTAAETEPQPAETTVPEETFITTTTSVPKNAAKPSPAQIKEVSSPGKTVFGPDNAKFDYSNCSKGYVSVNYTGSTKLKMLLKKDGAQYDYDIPAGNGIQYFTLAMGSGKYVVEIYEMVSGGKYIKLFSDTFSAKIADPTGMFLYRNQYVNFNAASKCVAKASEVCAGCDTNLEKIAAVFQYVTDNVTYDKALAASVTSGYIPDPDSVLAKKKGICFDYASLTAAMLRSQGVPTRLVIGYASPNIYHAWNEVYTEEKGWIAAEIQLDGTGFRRIDATFYASASNKKTFAEYIAKSGNYSDVYIY